MIKKGEVVLYDFGFSMIEAKVIRVYGNEYVKVKHKNNFMDWLFPYTQIVHTSRICRITDL